MSDEQLQIEVPLACEQAKIIAIDLDKRRITHVISTGRLDRNNRMVEPDGWKLANYRRAPRVLADHGYSIESVIGKAIDTKIDGDRLISTTEFDDEGLGAVAFRLAQNGLVNTWSVGWMGLKSHRIGEQEDCERCNEVKAKVEWGRHFIQQELLEYSLVAIPANPDAVNGLLAAGLVSSSAAEHWIETFKPLEAPQEQAQPQQRSPAFYRQLSMTRRAESIRAATKQLRSAHSRRVR